MKLLQQTWKSFQHCQCGYMAAAGSGRWGAEFAKVMILERGEVEPGPQGERNA